MSWGPSKIGARALALCTLHLWAACAVRRPPGVPATPETIDAGEKPHPGQTVAELERPGERIAAHPIRGVADLQQLDPLAAGEYRVHLIDVGTGLSVLVQGHDFNLLFDGGSADDKRGISASAGNRSRLVAYLWAALGPSGPAECKPVGDGWLAYDGDGIATIDHVVLSHPHEDHGVFLDEVLHCFDVDSVWNAGAVNDAAYYEGFVRAVAAEPNVAYHTASTVPKNRTVTVRGNSISLASVAWSVFAEGDEVELGDGARFVILHADGAQHNDPNENSIVLRVQLGPASVLLTGDAESGPREPPSASVGDIEEHLVQNHAAAIDVDVLQVGHHGSMTSSRRAFVDRVSPSWALIGRGPKKYAGHKLPDAVIVKELEDVGAQILRSDQHDGRSCPAADKIGEDDERPGGCDNWVLVIR